MRAALLGAIFAASASAARATPSAGGDVSVSPGRIAGAVRGAAGRGIAGATVTVVRRGVGEVARATAGAAGRFELAPLAPGVYDVSGSAPGHATASVRGLALLGGDAHDVTVRLPAAGAVEGAIRSDAGAPIAGARVEIAVGERGAPELGGAGVTGADGRYRVDGLPPGRHVAKALRPGTTVAVAQDARVQGGAATRVDFTLPALGAVEGVVSRPDGTRVERRPVAVTAMPDFMPALAVAATGGRPGPQAVDPAGAEADAEGRYRIALPPGSWFVMAQAGGPFGAVSERGLTYESLVVAVRPGETVRRDLVLDDRASPAAGEAVEIEVVQPDGTPATGARAVVATQGGLLGMSYAVDVDARGRCRLDVPAAARASLTVEARQGGRASPARPLAAGEERIRLVLAPAAAARGRVVDAKGARVRGFAVELDYDTERQADGAAVSLSFAGDRFELQDLRAIPAHVTVRTPDGRTGTAALALAPGATAEAEVAVARPRRR